MKNRSTGRLGRLFFNVVTPGVAACNAWGSQPLTNTTRFPITTFGNDVARGYLRGFTLIELLVVVLIIGILSAIALPQYQRAVDKSRAMQALVLVRSLANAQERYFLANGSYSFTFDNLDVQLREYVSTTCRSQTRDCREVKGFVLENFKSGDGTASVEASTEDYILVSYLEKRWQDKYGRLTCLARTARGDRLCKSLGGRISADKKGYYVVDF